MTVAPKNCFSQSPSNLLALEKANSLMRHYDNKFVGSSIENVKQIVAKNYHTVEKDRTNKIHLKRESKLSSPFEVSSFMSNIPLETSTAGINHETSNISGISMVHS
jgi:hypothetical protein